MLLSWIGLILLLVNLIGNKVIINLKGNNKLEGILSSATLEGEISLGLKQVKNLNDSSSPLKPSLLILARDLLELNVSNINLNQQQQNKNLIERESFKIDNEVTGLNLDKREKKLQAWGGDNNDSEDNGIGGMSLDDDNSLNSNHRGAGNQQQNRNWDQFATHERMYGTRSDYHEDIYTTKLDRSGTDYRAREQRAAQLEKEILNVRFIFALTAFFYTFSNY